MIVDTFCLHFVSQILVNEHVVGRMKIISMYNCSYALCIEIINKLIQTMKESNVINKLSRGNNVSATRIGVPYMELARIVYAN